MVARAAAAEERMVGKRSIGVPTYSCTVAFSYLEILQGLKKSVKERECEKVKVWKKKKRPIRVSTYSCTVAPS